ncbi:MAG: TIGR04211 family SH3 domain-containing protein [Gammaproteobacteria bacterium]|nr:TIGR04211 family SH3 domain-containing protein [Gammaproteobacteria bacterium]
MKAVKLIFIGGILVASHVSSAVTKYVTDEFEIMLRTGQSTQHEIRRQVKSGTPLVVLQESEGYTNVRMPNGVEGWVLSRYLMNQPSGRDRLAALEKRHEKLKTKFDQAVAEEKAAMQKEIAKLKDIAKRPLELQRQNDQLKAQLAQEKDRYDKLAIESEVLKSPLKDRQWFVSGAVVVIGSMIFGIVLTRIPWQRKKKWNQL